MPASQSLYQELLGRLDAATRVISLRRTALRRLALLVVGIMAAQTCVLTRVAGELEALGLTRASSPESVGRRLRRALGDTRLEPTTCYAPLVRELLDWEALLRGSRRVILAADDSSQDARVHLFRVALCYWGGSLPLAWASWPQNVALPPGQYWRWVDTVFDQVAALLPADVEVVVTADRAFDVPPFVDRVAARGWHWLVRVKARGTLRFRDQRGQEHALATLLRQRLPGPGRRWKGRGWVFKDAGWRQASIVAHWGPGQDEPLVVLSDLAPHWALLALYQRRFWVEPGFRNDKAHGWQWEQSQVSEPGHVQRLLLALALATLLTVCLGVQEAQARLAARRRSPRRPQPARQSLFTLGLGHLHRCVLRATAIRLLWQLPEPDAPAWNDRWLGHQRYRLIFGQTVRP